MVSSVRRTVVSTKPILLLFFSCHLLIPCSPTHKLPFPDPSCVRTVFPSVRHVCLFAVTLSSPSCLQGFLPLSSRLCSATFILFVSSDVSFHFQDFNVLLHQPIFCPQALLSLAKAVVTDNPAHKLIC